MKCMIHKLLLGGLTSLALTGLGACYAHQGQSLNLAPSELLEEALAACQRHDRIAYETLLTRVGRDYPDSEEARHSTELLAESRTCTPADTEQTDVDTKHSTE